MVVEAGAGLPGGGRVTVGELPEPKGCGRWLISRTLRPNLPGSLTGAALFAEPIRCPRYSDTKMRRLRRTSDLRVLILNRGAAKRPVGLS
jgi:hypothetical protein